MTARCDRTDLIVDQCACPDHRGGDIDDRPETVGQAFDAAYDGMCPLCGHHIHVGDRIARLADDDGYVHAGRCPQ